MEASAEAATLRQSQSGQPVMRSRPSSLLGPEKEPVNFNVNLAGAPPEVEQLVDHIKQVAEQFLYHWKTFPIVLPSPLCGGNSSSSASSNGNRKSRPINLRDLFVAPPFDELDAVAADGNGEPRRLTNNQLRSLRERGEFEVASLNFPGQVHRWRLSQLLQKGSERAHDSLLSDLALAARFIVVTAKSRLTGHFFSVAQGARAFFDGLIKILDMIVGVPSLMAHNLEYKIKEERCRFLVAELVCRPEYEDCMDSLTTYVRHQLRRATMEKFEVECDTNAQPIPYLFLTPKGQEIDLRLFSRDIMRKALPILIGILERETRGWFLHFRERLIAEMREKKMSDEEIEEEVNEAVMKEYLQRVYSSILSNTDLEDLGVGVPQLLVQQAQSVVIMHKAVEKIQRELKHCREEQQKNLTDIHPVLSRVAPWLRSRLSSAELSKLTKTTWSAHEEALKGSSKHNLQQTAYFLNRDMVFMKEREPVLLKELRNAKTPTRNFQWPCRIWSPQSWIIRRNFQGQSEVIPTVICQQATSIVTPRSDPSQPVFLVEKEINRNTSTRWPLWRLLNLIQRTWCWTWNMMFLLGIVVPWCSPLGLRALFCVKPFMHDLELSQINGTLFPRKTSITQTMASRLLELWRHISKARTHFETEPDTGFIGKGMTRHMNRMWNYVFKGFLGTLVIIFIFPLLCILVSLASIACALTAPLWVPIVTLLLHIYMMLIFDLDCPEPSRNRYCVLLEAVVWNIFVQGCLQPLMAVFVATCICPLTSVAVLCVGLTRYWLRLLWDSVTFHLFIKKCGRVPASDSLAVRRIAGPGLALDYYFVIKPEQALAAFEAKMEMEELNAFEFAMESVIMQPQKDFSQFVKACFGPFSAELSKTGPYRNLERESNDLIASLREKLEKRRRDLQTGLTPAVKAKIKMTTMELKIAIQQGAHLLERFYPSHVLPHLSLSEDEFWETRGISHGDWAGLAGVHYVEIFSLDFLTPVGDTETQFKLEAHQQLDLSRYSEMVQNASDIMGVNGPDLLGNVYAPRGNIQVHSPYLEVSAFNPRSRITMTFRKAEKRHDNIATGLTTPRVRARRQPPVSNANPPWRPWKRKHGERNPAEKLLIPLPILHPVHIAIAIHNRDSEQPIPLDSELCWEILRAIEDCHGDLQAVSAIARFRGGVADSSLDSLSQTSEDSNESRESIAAVAEATLGTTETLPCGNRTTAIQTDSNCFQWTLSNWGAAQAAKRRNTSGTVRVDLASPEDISLDTDSSRAMYSGGAYGTNV